MGHGYEVRAPPGLASVATTTTTKAPTAATTNAAACLVETAAALGKGRDYVIDGAIRKPKSIRGAVHAARDVALTIDSYLTVLAICG